MARRPGVARRRGRCSYGYTMLLIHVFTSTGGILSYEDRVQQCKLTTLETRRVRGDQIEVFKITHGIEGLDSDMFFKFRTDNGTRGHSWALAKERCKLDIRKYAFSQRTINEWNRLPGECVHATSVNMFKNKIDNYFKRSGYV